MESEGARLEAATLESEISMSVVTTDTAFRTRRPSLLDRLRSAATEDDMERQKKYCCGILNVEPVLLLVSIAAGLFATSQPLFTYWARCVEIAAQKFPDEANISSLCASIAADNNTDLQDLVETDIAAMKIYLQIASSAPTLLVAPLVGTWSDKTGRKFPLIFTMGGFVLYSVFYLIATLTYEQMNIYSWFFVSEIGIGMCGGLSSMFATMLAVVTDDCRHKLKAGSSSVPLRIGIASAIQSIGNLLGTFAVSALAVPAIVSVTAHGHSYTQCAFVQCVCIVAAFVYTMYFVKETHHPDKDAFAASYGGYVERLDSESSQAVAGRGWGCHGLFSSLCEVMCEPRPGWTRLCLNLSIFFVLVEFLALDAGLLFLLVKRQPFVWSDSLFSLFNVVRILFFSLGMILGPLLLTKLNILGKDSILIFVGTLFSAVSYYMLSFASTTGEIFVTGVMALLVGGIAPGYRTFLPRMVPKEQTARLLTVVSIVLAFCPILSSLIFNNLFNWSISWWPGFAFLVGGVFQTVAALGQLMIHSLMRPQWKLDKELKEHRKRIGLEEDDAPRVDTVAESDERSVSNTAVGSEINYAFEEDNAPLNT